LTATFHGELHFPSFVQYSIKELLHPERKLKALPLHGSERTMAGVCIYSVSQYKHPG